MGVRTPKELQEAYYEGNTIEELALEEDTYPGKIRKLLKSVDTVMRKRGERIPGKESHHANAKAAESQVTGVHRISTLGGPPRKGYRRRGRL